MDPVILEDLEFRPDLEGLKKKLRVRDGGGWTERFERLVHEAATIARPRALYGVAYIDSKSEGSVMADGVRLTDSLLMVPSKSVSGIRFPTERTFASCQLCPRAGCPSRQAPYDPALYDKKYGVEKVESPSAIAQQDIHGGSDHVDQKV